MLKYPIRVSYQKSFLKHIIKTLELQGCEVHDCFYTAYGRLVALDEAPESFKHYLNDLDCIVTLKENNSFISEGTTGLCTWQVIIFLGTKDGGKSNSDLALFNSRILKNLLF